MEEVCLNPAGISVLVKITILLHRNVLTSVLVSSYVSYGYVKTELFDMVMIWQLTILQCKIESSLQFGGLGLMVRSIKICW